jgi:hypothetical protein
MKRFLLFNFVVLIILTLSCKKSTDESSPVVKADYYQLKVGNYWIYKSLRIDSAGVDTTYLPKLDSTYIQKDTTIRGNTYYKLFSDPAATYGGNMISFLRDSSGYLINHLGKILCSNDNFTQVLGYDSIMPKVFMGYLSMTGRDSTIQVPVGAFQSITLRMKIVPSSSYPQIPIRYTYSSYGKGVGRIKTHDIDFMGNVKFEGWLIRYKVN